MIEIPALGWNDECAECEIKSRSLDAAAFIVMLTKVSICRSFDFYSKSITQLQN